MKLFLKSLVPSRESQTDRDNQQSLKIKSPRLAPLYVDNLNSNNTNREGNQSNTEKRLFRDGRFDSRFNISPWDNINE